MASPAEQVAGFNNALAIGWGPTERASEVIVSLAVFARGISLYFTRGASKRPILWRVRHSGSVTARH